VTLVDAASAVNTDTETQAAFKNKKSEVRLQNRDILDIKEDIASIHSRPCLSMGWFAFLLCLPALGFGVASTVMQFGARE
jgi:hypothetical protein